MLRPGRVEALLCVVWLLGCGGSASQKPSANAADARLAESAEADAPEAAALGKQGEANLGQNDAAGAKELFEQALAQNGADSRAALGLGIASELLGDSAGAE